MGKQPHLGWIQALANVHVARCLRFSSVLNHAGHAVELELAVSSVMGSGLFICCVSLAGVLFVKGIGITDRCCCKTAALHFAAVALSSTFSVSQDGLVEVFKS